MKARKLLPILMCMALVFSAGGVLATDTTPIEYSGAGTVIVVNTGPVVDTRDIYDPPPGLDIWPANLDVDHTYEFWVNVTDDNTMDDIKYVHMEFYVTGHESDDDGDYRYVFHYAEPVQNDFALDGATAGNWVQDYPTAGGNLNSANCNIQGLFSDDSGSYVFEVVLDTTAKAGGWKFNATVYDASDAIYELSAKGYNIYRYLEMDYDTGEVGQYDLAWTDVTPGDTDVPAGADIQVTVTANAPYTMSGAYWNTFKQAGIYWGNTDPLVEPVFHISHPSALEQTLVNNTDAHDQWIDWVTLGSTGPTHSVTTFHTITLDIPALLPLGTYTGPTIYIRASV